MPTDTITAPPPTTTVHLTADTAVTTPDGATFTAPAGWWLQSEARRRILTGPEPDLRTAFVDVKTASADDAVAAAWPALIPGFKRPLRLAQPRPARHGWDEVRDYAYETSPNEKLVVGAAALRHGDTWTVVVYEVGLATLEKREASMQLVDDTLFPPGYSKESFAGKTPHALDADRLKAITGMVDRGREALGVPGVAIGLVQGGKVVFAGGLGVRELGKPAKVDAASLFMIGSNTKALTTLLLATEVDQGKFTWDTPVTQVYPGFRLGDADTTSKVLMRHMICACTGLPRQDLEWIFEFAKASPKSALELLGTMQPTTRFGETFQYSNLMAAAAGYIGAHVADPKKELGAAYDEAMRARIFGPLGMKSTTFDYGRAFAGDHAAPHGEDIDGKMHVSTMDPNRAIIPVRPAGAAWSSVDDMLRYVQMELARGKLPDGKTLVSEEALLARRAPQVRIGEHTTYGMGLEVDTEYGVPVVHHGGAVFGFRSDMFWLPDQGVGGVILTNAGIGGALLRPFLRKVLEELYDGKPEAMEDIQAIAKAHAAELAKDRERLVVPPAADVVAKLAKHYTSVALGDVTVRTAGPVVTFDFGEWRSTVASRKNDDGTTSMITVDPGVGGFEFVVTEKGGKRALVIRDMQHEYVLAEAP
jgi:CubicO group peptidase (beta-lactamase class C family)